jgi:hypothetical protein
VTRAKKVVTVALVAFVTLVVLDFSAISPWGILIRPDPMWVGDNGVIEDMACDYATVLKTATVFIIGDKRGARCASFYRFGSIAPCVGATDLPPGACLWSQGTVFRVGN